MEKRGEKMMEVGQTIVEDIRTDIVEIGDEFQVEIDRLNAEDNRLRDLSRQTSKDGDRELSRQYFRQAHEVFMERRSLEKQRVELLREKLYVNRAGFNIDIDWATRKPRTVVKIIKGTKSTVDTIAEGLYEFSRFVDESTFPSDDHVVGVRTLKRGDTDFYDPECNDINLNAETGIVDVIHEMGHWLDHNNDGLGKQMRAFYEERTGDQQAKPMDGPYRTYGYMGKDGFIDPHMGISDPDYTEVLSMGLQYFYIDPYKLAKEDPEYFDIVYKSVRTSS